MGSQLIASAEGAAAAAGTKEIAVGVSDDNPAAERLYSRLGYLPRGIFDVCEYDWWDETGACRHERERDQVLNFCW